jgi:hypothetical protein
MKMNIKDFRQKYMETDKAYIFQLSFHNLASDGCVTFQ